MSNCTRQDLLNPCDILFAGADNVVKLAFNSPVDGHDFVLTISDPPTNTVVAAIDCYITGTDTAEALIPVAVSALLGSRVYGYSIRDSHLGLEMIVKYGRIAAKEVL